MLSDKKIGFVGNLQSEALLARMLEAGVIAEADACVVDGGVGVPEPLSRYAAVVLSLDERTAADLLGRRGRAFTADQLVISAVPGMPLERLEALIPEGAVARVISNIATLPGRGSTAICPGSRVRQAQLAVCRHLFEAVGATYEMAESLLGGFVAVSGCGPVFADLFVRALAQGGIAEGLPPEMAHTVAAEMMAGSAEMVLKTGQHPERLKDDVCSPGGGTIVGVHALEHGGFRGSVMDAVSAGRHAVEALDK